MERRPNQPIPEPEQRQNTPESGVAGPLGVSPPSPERDLPRQAEETAPAHGGSESTPVQQLERQREQPQGETQEEIQKRVFEHRQSIHERYLAEMRAIYDQDKNLFATRAMEALEALVREGMPSAQEQIERSRQKLISYDKAAGYTERFYGEHGRFLGKFSWKAKGEGRVDGIHDTFYEMHRHITDEPKK